MGRALHLAEGVVPSGVLRLPVMEGFVESCKGTLCAPALALALAFLDLVDELIRSALDHLHGSPDTKNEERQPGESKDQTDQGNHR
jgi:hypothetical protein